MKVLSFTAALSLIAVLASARNSLLEPECIQKLCRNFRLNESKRNGHSASGVALSYDLAADCKDNTGKVTAAYVNLGNCLGNSDGNPVWADRGDFDCSGCKLKGADSVVMECLCCTKKKKPVVREINLSEGIWVYDGAIGCY